MMYDAVEDEFLSVNVSLTGSTPPSLHCSAVRPLEEVFAVYDVRIL